MQWQPEFRACSTLMESDGPCLHDRRRGHPGSLMNQWVAREHWEQSLGVAVSVAQMQIAHPKPPHPVYLGEH